MNEKQFVAIAKKAANDVLPDRLVIHEGKALFYQININERLELVGEPRFPTRGRGAFQTDLCIFEPLRDDPDVIVPRVVFEMKQRLSTHDVLTYSTKARRHKQVYPYLRSGMVVGGEPAIPKRFFRHNEAMDFCVAAEGLNGDDLRKLLKRLIRFEVRASRSLERIAFGPANARMFRHGLSVTRSRSEADPHD